MTWCDFATTSGGLLLDMSRICWDFWGLCGVISASFAQLGHFPIHSSRACVLFVSISFCFKLDRPPIPSQYMLVSRGSGTSALENPWLGSWRLPVGILGTFGRDSRDLWQGPWTSSMDLETSGRDIGDF